MRQAPDTAAAPEATRSPHPRRLVRALLVILIVVVAVVGYRWLTHPDALQAYQGVNETGTILTVGQTIYHDTGITPAMAPGSDHPSSVTISLGSVTPVVAENTAQASIVVLVCLRNGNPTGVGTQLNGLSDSCSRVEPLDGPTTVTVGFMTAQIVTAITPRKAGTLTVTGYHVTYRQGIRNGTQHAGGGFAYSISR